MNVAARSDLKRVAEYEAPDSAGQSKRRVRQAAAPPPALRAIPAESGKTAVADVASAGQHGVDMRDVWHLLQCQRHGYAIQNPGQHRFIQGFELHLPALGHQSIEVGIRSHEIRTGTQGGTVSPRVHCLASRRAENLPLDHERQAMDSRKHML